MITHLFTVLTYIYTPFYCSFAEKWKVLTDLPFFFLAGDEEIFVFCPSLATAKEGAEQNN